MKKSKLLQIILVVLGVICLFSGCSEKEENPDEYTPTSSLEMTESEAAALGEKVRVVLYFTDKKGANLFPESQLLEFSARDRRSENMAQKICEMLIEGPADKDKFVNTISKDVIVKSVTISQGVATVDFSGNFTEKLSDNAEKVDLMMCALTNTLTELKDISAVNITVEGKNPGKLSNGYEFKRTSRNLSVVGTQPVSAGVEYTEEAFIDVPLE